MYAGNYQRRGRIVQRPRIMSPNVFCLKCGHQFYSDYKPVVCYKSGCDKRYLQHTFPQSRL